MVKQGTITTTGPTAVDGVNGFMAHGDFNVTVWSINPAAPWTGRILIERSFDNGANWIPVLYEAPSAVTDNHARFLSPFSARMFEPEMGVLYRLNCEQVKSGPNAPDNNGANYRFSQ